MLKRLSCAVKTVLKRLLAGETWKRVWDLQECRRPNSSSHLTKEDIVPLIMLLTMIALVVVVGIILIGEISSFVESVSRKPYPKFPFR